ncbi:uncharacterized membrane protein YgaE (UPF0421/DUF939 family) [Microbacter margulisiae]|uniref:Uncharacterized membrane protein YgaE (UPF0421/DUF939 family) n=1 Tax=Microbacter margulisiae TaxID=1350067 RepID=A0A7W5DQC5_9PORP|nr:uncharacterized membrane protein YgaE (UPF0421/DUF939 family) [Microbacter margulisiae]
METKLFNKSLKFILCVLIIFGSILIGIGIGMLTNRLLEAIFISIGLGLFIIATLLIFIEYGEYR